MAELDEEQILELTTADLKNIMQIAGKPVYWRIKRWAHAIPQYELGYEKVLDGLAEFEEGQEGMFFCANFRGGIAVGDCIMSASATAERAAAFLDSR